MRRILLLLLASLTPATIAGEGPDRPPAPVRSPLPTLPGDLRDGESEPTVRASVHVDERGRPRSVVILEVEPGSGRDERLAEAARAALRRWRFVPALRAGEPVEAVTEVTVRFEPPWRPPPGDPDWRMTADPTDDPTEGAASGDPSLSRVRQRRLEDAVDIIRRNMTRRARRIDSPRFSLWADVTEPAVSRRLSDALESAFSVLDRILGGRVPPQPEPRRVRVFLFDTHLAFERVKRELGISSRAHGFYRSPGLIVLHSDLMHDDRVFMVCLHEAVHAYLGRYVFRPGVRPPPWLGEGLAEYVASSRLERGELIPGRLPRGVLRDHLVGYVRTLRRALRAGAARGLGEMLEAGEDAIPTDRDERDRFYGSAWMTVHFLRHGRPEWADEAFPTLVLYLAEGYREGVFEAAYGLSPGELEDEFREYVRVFPRER